MRINKFFVLFILFSVILTISVTFAADVNDTTDYDNLNQNMITKQSEISLINQQIETTSQTKDNDFTDDNDNNENLTNDCCTTVMQVSENESLLSFRRDSYGSTINIYVTNNSSYIKQYKTANSYFFHVIISKDGWLVGNGGADSEYVNKLIESRALTMIENQKITDDDLNYISNLHKQLSVAHFLIKAPNGTYGFLIYSNRATLKKTGILKNGEYIACPNSRDLYQIGNYERYTQTNDLLKASKLLALKNKYAQDRRRNIMTYHYKKDLISSKIDFHVCNDDGSYVGSNTGYLRDNIVTDNKFISANNIPKGINSMYVDTFKYDFKYNVTITTQTKNDIKSGENISITTNVKTSNLPMNDGRVSVKFNGKWIGSPGVKNGIATMTYTIPNNYNGNYTIQTTYIDINNKQINTSNKNITVIRPVKMEINTPRNTTIDSTIKINIKVTDLKNNKINNGRISIRFNNKWIGSPRVKNGTATMTYTIPNNYSGNYKIQTTYIDIHNNQINVSNKNITVIRPVKMEINTSTNTTTGSTIKINIKVTDLKNNKINNGRISIRFNNKWIGSPSVKNGTATMTYTIPNNYNGNYTIQTTYIDINNKQVNVSSKKIIVS